MGSSAKTAVEIDQHKTQSKIFTNRVKGLKKRMSELTTLCGVEACMVSSGSNCKKLKSWPENKLEVLQILRKFKARKIEKKEETDRKTDKGNDDGTVSLMEDKGLSKDSMMKLLSRLDEKLEKIKERIEVLEVERKASRCAVKKEETNDSDESESGYCTATDLD